VFSRSLGNILIADTPQDFAQAVVRVIRDRELARHLAVNGRRWVEERYDWRVVYRKLDDVYRKLKNDSD
jgi:glycosyltransferase involved in cell wall biosynthesis